MSIMDVLLGRVTHHVVLGKASDYRISFAAALKPTIQLVYLDPPFNTGNSFSFKQVNAEGKEHFLPAFADRFLTPQAWAAYVVEIVAPVVDSIVPGGSLLVHIDPRHSHILRTAMDAFLGEEFEFGGEIVWAYRHWPVKTKGLQKRHDLIFRWVKRGVDPIFHVLYEPLAPSTVKSFGTKKQHAKIVNGKRVVSETTHETSPGVPLGDVWTDIGILAPIAKERTGWPTQKPEKLLSRLIQCFTHSGGVVVDLTCGSGTTLAAGLKLGRRVLGFDLSPLAVKITEERLARICQEITDILPSS